MRTLHKPALTFEECYKACACSYKKSELLQIAMSSLEQAHIDYEELAKNSNLHTYKPMMLEDQIKTTLKSLYTYGLVKKSPGRAIYNKILISSPLCPYCNLGKSMTLDHYLAKSEYPEFSINPLNLVPACRDCNMEKRDRTTHCEEKQYIHPYFDNIDFQWLNAKITFFNEKPIIEYGVVKDVLCTTLGKRIRHHFFALSINKSYELQANERLQMCHESFKNLRKSLKAYLIEESKRYPINNWEKSFYECLAGNDQFCDLEWEM